MIEGVSIETFRGDYRAVNLVSWTFNPSISLAGIPEVYEIQV
jgi:hypothetical protein